MACAVEDAGFLIKDQFIWLYTQNQPKAMSLNHVIDRLKISDEEKESLKVNLSGWKTPQVKSCHEPICMAQKPLHGSFLDNYLENGVGLVNTNVTVGDSMFPSNVASSVEFDEIVDRYFLVSKPKKSEKGSYNTHKTVKPLTICDYLISLTSREGDVVLDPFSGSGSTLVSAKRLKRRFIGIDLNKEYVEIAQQRLSEVE
jgi:site-specific DNA-methyltransferase (adenine-specific)